MCLLVTLNQWKRLNLLFIQLEFPRESALWPSDEDLLLITEPCFTERYAWQSQLLPNRDSDFTSIYHAALFGSSFTRQLHFGGLKTNFWKWVSKCTIRLSSLCKLQKRKFVKTVMPSIGLILGLARIPFFELRSFGSNQHRIFEASEGGAEHILCLHFYYVQNHSSNDFTRGGCVAADPRECSVAFWCNMDTRHVHN